MAVSFLSLLHKPLTEAEMRTSQGICPWGALRTAPRVLEVLENAPAIHITAIPTAALAAGSPAGSREACPASFTATLRQWPLQFS